MCVATYSKRPEPTGASSYTAVTAHQSNGSAKAGEDVVVTAGLSADALAMLELDGPLMPSATLIQQAMQALQDMSFPNRVQCVKSLIVKFGLVDLARRWYDVISCE